MVALMMAVGIALPARAADVTALPLPEYFTVRPEGEVRLVTLAADKTVAALAESTDHQSRTLAVRWDANGNRTTFRPLPVQTAPDRGESDTTKTVAGVVAAPGVVYVNVSENWSGAYSGVSFEAQRWIANESRRFDLTGCYSGDNEDQHANAADRKGRIAVTFDRTGQGSFTVMGAGKEAAPYAFVVDATGCHSWGRAVILDLRGAWASGYRGYIHGALAPTNLNTIIQRAVAVRWHGATLTELGEGVAYAVTEHGFAVGATSIAGRFDTMTTNFFGNPGRRYDSPVPHAVTWDAVGRRSPIHMDAARSVAYDVANDGTVVGMLQARDGKHYAFRWHQGRLQRLDDLPHPPGWRFEAAYAIADDGTIAGIGTINHIASVFRWRPGSWFVRSTGNTGLLRP